MKPLNALTTPMHPQGNVDNTQMPRTPATAPAVGHARVQQLNTSRPSSPTAVAVGRMISRSRTNSLQEHSTSSPTSNAANPEAQMEAKTRRREELRSNYETEYPLTISPFSLRFNDQNESEFKQQAQDFFSEKGLVLGRDYSFSTDPLFGFQTVIVKHSVRAVLRERTFKFDNSSDLDACIERLKGNAAQYMLQHHSFPDRPIPELANDASHETVIKTVLEKYEGIVIGEGHQHATSKQFVIDNLQTLKDRGVQTLFLEHLLSDMHRDALEQYLGFESGSAMPDKLRHYLEDQNRGHLCNGEQYNFFTLVEAAKEAGLKIVPIDCYASYFAYESGAYVVTEDTRSRIEVMNYLAVEKIKNRENDGKWIAFVGSAHANTHMDVPGVAELTDTLSVVVSDTKENPSNPSVRTNVKNYADKIKHVDIVIEPQSRV
ncbi:membrane-targeted effector domain-containing toxin [Undibacterium sp. SXout7W]|uniref:membrane-targeted effector domain-containing toxin n=1 Tax=Undibacterium sp. SXout7W TaxID=3413049 RepID=UPI003BF08382